MSFGLGLSQLRRIDDLLRRRAAVAARYDRLLGEVPGSRWRVAAVADASELVRLRHPGVPGIDRDEGSSRSSHGRSRRGRISRRSTCSRAGRKRFGFREGHLPVTERIAATTLALPFHANLSAEDMTALSKPLNAAMCARGRA